MEGIIGIILFIVILNLVSYFVRRQRARTVGQEQRDKPAASEEADAGRAPQDEARGWRGKQMMEQKRSLAPTARLDRAGTPQQRQGELVAPGREERDDLREWGQLLFGPSLEEWQMEPEEETPAPPRRVEQMEPEAQAPPPMRAQAPPEAPLRVAAPDAGAPPASIPLPAGVERKLEAPLKLPPGIPPERGREVPRPIEPGLRELLNRRGLRHGIVLAELLKPPLARRHYRQ